MNKSYAVLAALVVVLTGCAGRTPKPAVAEIPQTPLTVKVKFNSRADTGLRVVTRADTAKVVGLQILSGVLGGGSNTFKKEQLKGKTIQEVKNPSLTLLPEVLQTRLRDYAQKNPESTPPARFEMEAGDWVLIYQELGNSETLYELRYTTTVWARPASEVQGQHSPMTQICQPKPQAMALEAWKDNDFAEVRGTIEAYVAECADVFSERFPEVFTEKGELAAL